MTNELILKMTLDSWHSKIKDADTAFDKLSDEQLLNEVAPNRNRGIYLLGHLTAVHDRMLPLLGFGEQRYPQLNDFFIRVPDKSKPNLPSAKEIRQQWKNINAALGEHINKLQPDEWMQRHNSVSAEDFAKEPHRNKLSIIISRTNHLSYHLGQLAFLQNK